MVLWAKELMKKEGIKESDMTTLYNLNLGLFVNIEKNILKIEIQKLFLQSETGLGL